MSNEDIGFDMAQGYYIAAPMPLDAALDWVSRYKGDSVLL